VADALSHLKAFCAHPFSVMRYFCGDIVAVQAFLDKPGVRYTAEDPMLLRPTPFTSMFANGGFGHLISQRGDAAFGYGGWWSYVAHRHQGTSPSRTAPRSLLYWNPQQQNGQLPTMAQASLEPEVFDTGSRPSTPPFPVRINAWLEDHTKRCRANIPPRLPAAPHAPSRPSSTPSRPSSSLRERRSRSSSPTGCPPSTATSATSGVKTRERQGALPLDPPPKGLTPLGNPVRGKFQV
jgi:hypothetical protein